jgi:hypothetical protein
MKISILELKEALVESGYQEEDIDTFIGVIQKILENGSVGVNGFKLETPTSIHINASGVHPLAVLHQKSADVYLNTSKEMNLLRIHHPTNSWHEKNWYSKIGTRCLFTSRNWIKRSAWEQKPEWIANTFHF